MRSGARYRRIAQHAEALRSDRAPAAGAAAAPSRPRDRGSCPRERIASARGRRKECDAAVAWATRPGGARPCAAHAARRERRERWLLVAEGQNTSSNATKSGRVARSLPAKLSAGEYIAAYGLYIFSSGACATKICTDRETAAPTAVPPSTGAEASAPNGRALRLRAIAVVTRVRGCPNASGCLGTVSVCMCGSIRQHRGGTMRI